MTPSVNQGATGRKKLPPKQMTLTSGRFLEYRGVSCLVGVNGNQKGQNLYLGGPLEKKTPI